MATAPVFLNFFSLTSGFRLVKGVNQDFLFTEHVPHVNKCLGGGVGSATCSNSKFSTPKICLPQDSSHVHQPSLCKPCSPISSELVNKRQEPVTGERERQDLRIE